jgi:hypothetical protein
VSSSVLTDSVVEVILFDHSRLQEMDLSPDVVNELMKSAPEYVDEEQALKQQIEAVRRIRWYPVSSLRLM